jgi:uncharacterized protein
MNLKNELSDTEEQQLNDFLGRVGGGAIPNIEALDGFFAALACSPDLVMPSEYMPILQLGETEDGDLDFKSMEEMGWLPPSPDGIAMCQRCGRTRPR